MPKEMIDKLAMVTWLKNLLFLKLGDKDTVIIWR